MRDGASVAGFVDKAQGRVQRRGSTGIKLTGTATWHQFSRVHLLKTERGDGLLHREARICHLASVHLGRAN